MPQPRMAKHEGERPSKLGSSRHRAEEIRQRDCGSREKEAGMALERERERERERGTESFVTHKEGKKEFLSQAKFGTDGRRRRQR